MSPEVTAFFDDATFTISYVVKDPNGSSCAIVDSVLDFDYASGRTDTRSADAVINYVQENNLTVEWLLESHVHADHLSAAPTCRKSWAVKLASGIALLWFRTPLAKCSTRERNSNAMAASLINCSKRATHSISGKCAARLCTPLVTHPPA